MARYRARRTPRRSVARRKLQWATFSNVGGEGLEFSDTNMASPANALTDFETAQGSDVSSATITRIRGHVWWVPAATAVQEYTGLALGFMIWNSSDASTLTDAQQANRLNQPYRDWMYYKRIQTASAAADLGVTTTGWQNELDVDIKSQRKFDELNETLYFFAGLTDSIGDGNSIRVFYDFRILLKRP